MSQVLLIDDELLVIEAIKCNVDWDACGVSDVFLCDNGFEAQAVMNEHDIDLVISDVLMPGMDGLDFGRWAKKNFPNTALIFISGYAEFEYAQTAITLGVEEYILKPIKYPELQERIMRIMALREQERKQKPDIDLKKSVSLLEDRDIDAFESLIESQIVRFTVGDVISQDLLQDLYNRFVQIIYSFIGASFETRSFLLQDEQLTRLKENALRSADSFRAYYRSVLEKIRQYQETEQSKNVIQDVINYIDSHIGEKLSRAQLAKLAYYNESYLSRRFHEEVGFSISTYIMQKRLEASKKLLMQTNLPITEIGEKVGYESTAYFIRIFKQQTGKTPKEFRKTMNR